MRTKHNRPKSLSFNRMIPNILTMLALCSGLTSLHFGLQAQWEAAVAAIIIAGVLDGLDGRIARMLKSTSKFGAELDSLSDFVSFGVAPALLLYLWSLQYAGRLGWVVALVFVVSCASRLARFNTDLDTPMPAWAYNFFTGVPAPAGAVLALLPMMLWFETGGTFLQDPLFTAANLVIVGGLMVSRLPTYSFKKFRVPMVLVLPTMLGVGLLAALIVATPWTTLVILGLIYITSLPLSYRSFRFLRNRAEELQRQVRGGDNTAPTDDTPDSKPDEDE